MQWRTIWRPAVYHGHGASAPYFEGWYFKLVNAAGDRRYAIIPGIFKHEDPAESHSFVQVLDGVSGASVYHRYPASDFRAAGDEFDVQVGPNRFRGDAITLAIEDGEQPLRGALRFHDRTPWPVRRWSPGVMGWYGFMPFMECYHGVLSFDHTIEGALTVGTETIDFSGGRGYQEKDWGQAFPRGYIWMQTNHFAGSPGTSLTASVALIPWLWRAFRGFIVGLWHGGVLYRFATYTGAAIESLTLTDTHVHWTMRGQTGTGATRGTYRLSVDAERASGGLLHAPDRVAMVERIVESMTAEIRVELVRLDGGESPVFSGTGQYGGLEIAGDLDTILDGYGGRARPPGGE